MRSDIGGYPAPCWGYTLLEGLTGAPVTIYLAQAGVYHGRRALSSPMPGLPHKRGGPPLSNASGTISAPQQRGSTSFSKKKEHIAFVSSQKRGSTRSGGPHSKSNPVCPAQAGGLPFSIATYGIPGWVTPHERGFTAFRLPRLGRARGYPANAGVYPPEENPWSPPAGLPRTTGGLPWIGQLAILLRQVTPYERRCTRGIKPSHHGPEDCPEPAGIHQAEAC